jgi:hypothetical protein
MYRWLLRAIMQMICITLANTKSPLVKASVKLKHLEAYSRGSDLEEFEGFVENIMR